MPSQERDRPAKLPVRVAAADAQRYRQAAAAAGMEFSEWVRQALDRVASAGTSQVDPAAAAAARRTRRLEALTRARQARARRDPDAAVLASTSDASEDQAP